MLCLIGKHPMGNKWASQEAGTAPTEPFLPTELMIEVLHFYIDSLPPKSLRKERRNLSLVCQLWRRIVESTPTMWQRICLDEHDYPRVPYAHLESVLNMWIGKAGNQPLQLEAYLRESSWFSSEKDSQRIVGSVLRESASRWRTLKLDHFKPLGLAVDTRKSRERYRECPPVRWEMLEDIHITNAHCDDRPITHPIPRPSMPRLRILTLIGGTHNIAQYFFIFPFQNLHYITIFQLRTGLIGPILQQCPQLKAFSIHGHSYNSGNGYINADLTALPSPVALTDLQYATIWIDGAHGAQMLGPILNPILLPNLQAFDVQFGRTECQPLEGLSMTILRDKIVHSHNTSLTSATICNPGGTQENLLGFLIATPSLRRLDLTHSFPDLEFLEKCNKQKALPSLETLRIEVLAFLWPKSSRVGANQQDKLNGRDMVKLKHLKTVFNKFTQERGYKVKSDAKFESSSWSVQLKHAEYVASTTNNPPSAVK